MMRASTGVMPNSFLNERLKLEGSSKPNDLAIVAMGLRFENFAISA